MVEELVNVSDFFNISESIAQDIGELGLWIQAIGLIVILWIVFQVINLIINIKRGVYLRRMKKDIMRIEEKVDKLGRKKR